MPQAKRTLGPLLDIQLDSIGRPYQPGDIITGRVVRAAPTVSPTATLGIQLLGRAKAKIVVTRYNGNNTTTSYYRSRYNFFDAADTQTRQQLHQGPIHVPSYNEPASWEFSVQIPTRASPRAVVSEAKNPEVSYLPLDATSVAASPLPSSFFNHGRHGNTRFDAYVKYHLEATLIQQGKNHHGADTVTATLPLHLRGPHMPYPLADSDLRRRSSPFAASSYRLVPGMEKAELTFKQKSKKFFGASSVPTFGFALQYESPGIIQLGGSTPAPIPFRVRVVPDRIRTSEALRGVPQVVTIASLEMVLKADTCVVAPGTFSTHDGGDTVKHHVQLPVAFAGDVPAAVLSSAAGCGGEEKAGSVGGGAAGGPPSGKEAAHRGAVHRPGVAGDKPGAVPPAEERVESSASSSNQPTAAGCSARESVEQPPSVTAPELKVEPPADSSAPPTYQPRADDPPPPPPLPPTPPPAAAVTKDEQPPAYQLPRDLSTRGPLVIPSSWDADGPWLDVGAAVALRLHETHATVMGRSISTTVSDPVTPSFTTYCIRHTHRLKWKMTVAVGGETVTLEAEAPVSVLGAAESG